VRNGRTLAVLLALSLAAWLPELGVFYVLMLAFPMPASLPVAMLGGSVSNFATLIPSSPGYVGTFDGALVKVVSDVLGNTLMSSIAAYAVLVHLALLVPVTAAGAVIMWRSDTSVGKFARMARQRAVMDPAAAA